LKLWSGASVSDCRICAHLRRPFVLGKNLNSRGQLKSSVVLVAFLAMIGEMYVEGRVKWTGGIFGSE